jgi:hypothetical protein
VGRTACPRTGSWRSLSLTLSLSLSQFLPHFSALTSFLSDPLISLSVSCLISFIYLPSTLSSPSHLSHLSHLISSHLISPLLLSFSPRTHTSLTHMHARTQAHTLLIFSLPLSYTLSLIPPTPLSISFSLTLTQILSSQLPPQFSLTLISPSPVSPLFICLSLRISLYSLFLTYLLVEYKLILPPLSLITSHLSLSHTHTTYLLSRGPSISSPSITSQYLSFTPDLSLLSNSLTFYPPSPQVRGVLHARGAGQARAGVRGRAVVHRRPEAGPGDHRGPGAVRAEQVWPLRLCLSQCSLSLSGSISLSLSLSSLCLSLSVYLSLSLSLSLSVSLSCFRAGDHRSSVQAE